MGDERRKHARVSVAVEVDITSEHNFYVGRTRDISAGGLFIETDMDLPVDTRIAADLIHPETGAEFPLVCKVRRRSAGPPCAGLGVEIVGFDEAQREAFGQFVYSGVAAEPIQIVEEDDPGLA